MIRLIFVLVFLGSASFAQNSALGNPPMSLAGLIVSKCAKLETLTDVIRQHQFFGYDSAVRRFEDHVRSVDVNGVAACHLFDFRGIQKVNVYVLRFVKIYTLCMPTTSNNFIDANVVVVEVESSGNAKTAFVFMGLDDISEDLISKYGAGVPHDRTGVCTRTST